MAIAYPPVHKSYTTQIHDAVVCFEQNLQWDGWREITIKND